MSFIETHRAESLSLVWRGVKPAWRRTVWRGVHLAWRRAVWRGVHPGWIVFLLALVILVPACGRKDQEASQKGATPDAAEHASGAADSSADEEGFSLLTHAMTDSVEEARLGYRSGDLQVTGYLFIDPFSEEDVEPCLIFNHGGVSGVSEAVKQKCRWLARQGFLVFAPSYRGEDGGEGQVEVAQGEVDDVLAAMQLLRRHPGVKDQQFVMIGTSHGALISVMVAARPLGKELLKGVVAAYGVMDIYHWYQYLVDNGFDVSDSLSQRIYGNGPSDKPEAFARRNALALVQELGELPILLVQGGKDRIVPPDQASRMAAALSAAGRTHDALRIYPHGGHGFLFWDDPAIHSSEELAETEQAWREILEFLRGALAAAQPPRG